ncbi:MAG: MaoC/PaaZ C-terminal domain-containing protein, partial [Acidimicrobiia bacterium]|nr:MaoC/PaaZ C-terminal domain-containing protein [Acidimicrobiia bacterium]
MPATTTFVALSEPPEVAAGNPIHGDEVAAQVGYQGALVSGVHTYGWATEAVIEALGEGWLDRGWADVSFRRPLYEGERITTTVDDDGNLSTRKDDGTVVLEGRVGLGDGPFAADLVPPTRRRPEPEPAELEYLLLASAPVGSDFRPMRVRAAESPAWSKSRLGEPPGSRYLGERPRLNPAWIAARMTTLVRHSYHYGPAIHARTRMQHLAPGWAEGDVTVAARLAQVYERKGHHYHESDCLVLADDGTEVACFRHTGIFRIAG